MEEWGDLLSTFGDVASEHHFGVFGDDARDQRLDCAEAEGERKTREEARHGDAAGALVLETLDEAAVELGFGRAGHRVRFDIFAEVDLRLIDFDGALETVLKRNAAD